MTLKISWSTLTVAVLVYFVTLTFYRLFLHPLARFPGPRLAAVSRWYEAYFDVVLGGKYTSKIAQLHQAYGPIIRISPPELHVIDPAFFGELYRNDGRWDKYSWAYDAFGARNSTIFGSSHDAHKIHRRAIAPYFSKANVIARQELLHRNVDKLSRRVSDHTGKLVNLGAALSAFTRDSANEYILDKRYDELELEDFGIGLSIVSSGAGVFWRTTKHIRWFGPALRAMPIEWMKKTADEATKSFLSRLQRSEQDTQEIMNTSSLSSPSDTIPRTMVEVIMQSNLPAADKTFARIFDEVATVTGAASETTAGTLRLILFHIFVNPEVVGRLRDEIDSLPVTPSEPIDFRKLEQLPYLTAVLMEGMRLSPATASRAARVTDKDLFYNEWCIPAGTPVGMTTLLMHTHESTYPDPMRFNPDRWRNPADRAALASRYAPFSKGTRMCLGMHMAWAEMYLVVAALVQKFDFVIKDATASDFEMERDNFGIGTKAGCNLMAHVELRKR